MKICGKKLGRLKQKKKHFFWVEVRPKKRPML